MKKATYFFLALVLFLSLCACGPTASTEETTPTEVEEETAPTKEETAPTKEEMLQTAQKVSTIDILNSSKENIAKAKLEYCNKTLLLSGIVREIKEDHIELCIYYGASYHVDVYLPLEEIVTLERGQGLTVVGKTTDEILESSEAVGGYTFKYKFYQMPTAYIVSDTVEMTAVYRFFDSNTSSIQVEDFSDKTADHLLNFIQFTHKNDTCSEEERKALDRLTVTFSARAKDYDFIDGIIL